MASFHQVLKFQHSASLRFPACLSGYLKSETEFQARVEEEAVSFRPLGQLIHSYTRPSSTSKGKGKGIGQTPALDPESEDALVFEVYHVRPFIVSPCLTPTLRRRQRGIHPDSKTTIVECSYLFCSILKLAHTLVKMKIHGNLSCCESLVLPLLLTIPRYS